MTPKRGRACATRLLTLGVMLREGRLEYREGRDFRTSSAGIYSCGQSKSSDEISIASQIKIGFTTSGSILTLPSKSKLCAVLKRTFSSS